MPIDRRIFRVITVVGLSIILMGAFYPSPLPHTENHLDKLYHVLAFLFLTVAFYLSFGRKWYFYIVFTAFLAVAIELGQAWFVTQRTASLGDIFADIVGIMLALPVCHFLKVRLQV
jgi:VanZ family protein